MVDDDDDDLSRKKRKNRLHGPPFIAAIIIAGRNSSKKFFVKLENAANCKSIVHFQKSFNVLTGFVGPFNFHSSITSSLREEKEIKKASLSPNILFL